MTKTDMDFIKQVGKLKQTTDNENRDLVKLYLSGDKDALTNLIEGMLKMVSMMAKKQYYSYTGDMYTIHDLIAAGCLGIERATNNFDPNAKTKFTSYAYWWIMKMMYEEKKKWGMMCVSLDDPLSGAELMGFNPYDYSDCNTLKDILNEDDVNEQIALLRMKGKRKIKQKDGDEIDE